MPPFSKPPFWKPPKELERKKDLEFKIDSLSNFITNPYQNLQPDRFDPFFDRQNLLKIEFIS